MGIPSTRENVIFMLVKYFEDQFLIFFTLEMSSPKPQLFQIVFTIITPYFKKVQIP